MRETAPASRRIRHARLVGSVAEGKHDSDIAAIEAPAVSSRILTQRDPLAH
jgi:hypothetical protein